jgi:hypothetical protein
VGFEINGLLRTAKCDACGFTTPGMRVANEDVAAQVLRAAGWRISGSTTLCPRCFARPFFAGRGTGMPRAA